MNFKNINTIKTVSEKFSLKSNSMEKSLNIPAQRNIQFKGGF